jgi:hypothetical protein
MFSLLELLPLEYVFYLGSANERSNGDSDWK